MLTLKAFGALDFRDEACASIPELLAQPKRSALLAYLILAHPDAFCRRDTLLALFWPDLDDQAGRRALNQALSFLRRHLPEGVVLTRGDEEVGVDAERVRSDVHAFEAALAAGAWADALGHYRGELLDGLHVAGAAPFTDWVDRERERLREAAAGAAWNHAHALIAEGRQVDAERVGQLALRLVPTDESAVRGFIRALAEAGDRAGALRFYDRFAAVLEQELEVEPAPETQDVARQVRSGAIAAAALSEPARAPATPGVRSPGTAPAQVRGKGRKVGLAAASVAAVALVAVGAWALLGRGGPVLDPKVREPVVVLPFEVRGSVEGLETLGIDAADRITAALEGASLGEVVKYRPEEGGRPFTARLGRRVLRETGAATLVVGTIAQRGDRVEVQAQVVRGSDLKTLWTLGPELAPAADPTAALDAIKERVLGAAGWYLSPATEHLQNAGGYQPPPSLEVLRLALRAEELIRRDEAGAVPILREACLRDSTWLAGPLRLARLNLSLTGWWQARDSLLAFLEARRERLYPLDALMLNWVQGSWGSPEARYRAGLALYQADPGWAHAASQAALEDRRPLEALRYYALRDTTTAFGREWQDWDNLAAQAYHMLGRFEEELALVRAAKAREPRAFGHWEREVRCLGALGWVEELEQVITESHGLERQGAPEVLATSAALELSQHGFTEPARAFARRAVAGIEQWPASAPNRNSGRNSLGFSLQVLGDHEALLRAYDEDARRVGLSSRMLKARSRILLGDTAGVLALVDSARTQPLTAYLGTTWNRKGLPYYYGAQLLALLGRKAEAVALYREALNNGWRLSPNDVPAPWYWAPLKDYPPFQELMKLKDGS